MRACSMRGSSTNYSIRKWRRKKEGKDRRGSKKKYEEGGEGGEERRAEEGKGGERMIMI